jgi:hypothetical protein
METFDTPVIVVPAGELAVIEPATVPADWTAAKLEYSIVHAEGAVVVNTPQLAPRTGKSGTFGNGANPP